MAAGTERDRSERYDSDPLVRLIEDTIRTEPMQRRLYPDLYSEKLADAITSHLEREGADGQE